MTCAACYRGGLLDLARDIEARFGCVGLFTTVVSRLYFQNARKLEN